MWHRHIGHNRFPLCRSVRIGLSSLLSHRHLAHLVCDLERGSDVGHRGVLHLRLSEEHPMRAVCSFGATVEVRRGTAVFAVSTPVVEVSQGPSVLCVRIGVQRLKAAVDVAILERDRQVHLIQGETVMDFHRARRSPRRAEHGEIRGKLPEVEGVTFLACLMLPFQRIEGAFPNPVHPPVLSACDSRQCWELLFGVVNDVIHRRTGRRC